MPLGIERRAVITGLVTFYKKNVKENISPTTGYRCPYRDLSDRVVTEIALLASTIQEKRRHASRSRTTLWIATAPCETGRPDRAEISAKTAEGADQNGLPRISPRSHNFAACRARGLHTTTKLAGPEGTAKE